MRRGALNRIATPAAMRGLASLGRAFQRRRSAGASSRGAA
jgi:hypothetical protein